jgi:hypothetical protein
MSISPVKLFEAQQLVDFVAIEAHDDLAADVDDGHTSLARAAHHIARGRRITTHIDVTEFDALLALRTFLAGTR